MLDPSIAPLGSRIAVAALLLIPTGGACAVAQDAPVDATLVDANGKSVKLSEWRGRSSLVLLFMRGFKGDFACFHCGGQARAYKSAYAKLHDAGAEVLAILPGATDARGFLEKIGTSDAEHPDPGFSVPFPVLGDPDFSACRVFSVGFDASPDAFPFPVSEPATIVLGKDGRVVYSYHGTDPSDRPQPDAILDVLLHGPPGAKAKTPAKPSPASSAPTLPWKSYAEGTGFARKSGKPMLLDFHAVW